jgi:hypothetical protein
MMMMMMCVFDMAGSDSEACCKLNAHASSMMLGSKAFLKASGTL